MTDIVISENLLGQLVAVFLFETAMIFAFWIESRIKYPENQTGRFRGFQSSDYLQLIISICLLGFVIYYLRYSVLPLFDSVSNLINEQGIEKSLPYMSLSVSFLAVGISLISLFLGFFKEVFSTVHARNNFNDLNEKLLTIEKTLKRVENNQK